MQKIAEFYKALGDETRLKIITMLEGRELCVCEVIAQLGLSQPAVSHHLRILKHAGVVKDAKEGRWIYYSLNPRVFEAVFYGEERHLLESYAEPLKQKIAETASLQTRKGQGCER